MRILLLVLTCLTTLRVAGASSVTLYGPSPSPDLKSIVISIGRPRPDFGVVAKAELWHIVIRPVGALTAKIITVSEIKPVDPKISYAITGMVRLILSAPLTDLPDGFDVILDLDKSTTASWRKKKSVKPQGSFGDPVGFYPAESKTKADVYLFGAIASGVGAKPSYNIEAAVASPTFLLGHKPAAGALDHRNFNLSAFGTAKTADQPKLDPDSFSAGLQLGMRRPIGLDNNGRSYFTMQWDTAKLEFSRKDQAFNFVSAPTAIFNVGGAAKNSDGSIRASASLDLFGGLEFGKNLRNKVVPQGYGAIMRLVPGAAAYFIFPGALGTKQISFTSEYHSRILFTREPFVGTRGAMRNLLTQGSRHTLTDAVSIKLNDYFSIQGKYEYGSLPPAFKFVDHEITIGISTMWKWRK